MKILLLALGNTPLKYDQNPYFFENLVDSNENGDVEIITFGYNEGLTIRINPQDDFKEVINRLPTGWIPDCCILQAIDNNLLPRGIEKAPFPLVAIPLPGDWDLDLPYTKAIVEAVDLVIGSGYFDEENYPVVGASNVEIFYIGSVMDKFFDPHPQKLKDRPVDIFYTASWLNNLSRTERSQWAAKLATLSSKHNVLIESWNRSYEEYLSMLRNSKLAFSNVRQGVFSNRVFEAASQGTIPVVTGRDVKRYFEDGAEIISVTDEDFVEKVEYYLANETLLQEMSKRVYEKVRRDFESRARFQRLLELIKRRGCKQTHRPVSSLGLAERHNRNGEIYFYSYCRGVIEGFGYWFADKNTSAFLGTSIEEFKKALNLNPSPGVKTNLAVALSAFMFEKDKTNINEKEVGEIVSILMDVSSDAPNYVMSYFNMAIFYFRLGRFKDALRAFVEVIRLFEDDTCEFDPWCLQNRDYELYKTLLKKPLNENLLLLLRNEPCALTNLKNLIQFATFYFISLIYEEGGDLYTCFDSLKKAYDLYPIHPLIVKKIAQVAGILGYKEECLDMYNKATELMPTDVDIWMDKIKYLYLYREDSKMLREIGKFKEIIMGIKPLNDKIHTLSNLMNSFGRFNNDSPFFDVCKETMLNNMVCVLYSCLKRNPKDIRLIIRIIEIWHELGRLDPVLELVEDYLENVNVKELDNDTFRLIIEIYRYIEDFVVAQKQLLVDQFAILPEIREGVIV